MQQWALAWEGVFETNDAAPELLTIKSFCFDDFLTSFSIVLL